MFAFSNLSNFSIIILIEALEEEVWSLNNLEEVLLGQHTILPRQSDHPPRLCCCHFYAVRFKDAKVIIERNASLSILVKLQCSVQSLSSESRLILDINFWSWFCKWNIFPSYIHTIQNTNLFKYSLDGPLLSFVLQFLGDLSCCHGSSLSSLWYDADDDRCWWYEPSLETESVASQGDDMTPTPAPVTTSTTSSTSHHPQYKLSRDEVGML